MTTTPQHPPAHENSQGWSGVADAYARTFAPLCEGTVDVVLDRCGLTAGTQAGRHLLDVGAGTGLLAARATALGANVVAVDPDPHMMRLTAANAPECSVLQTRLPLLPFADGTFDAVTCNFVVNHVHDPRAAVHELARVTTPGGQVVVTIWPSGQSAQSQLWSHVIADAGAVEAPAARLPPDLDFSRTSEGLASLFAEVGLRDVAVESVEWMHRTYADALWDGAAAGIGGIGLNVTSQTPNVRARMRDAYLRHVTRFVEGDDLALHTSALLAVATVTE